uniref:Reverse transcriptase domain-containing protein n=1 Tax=Caenorhabditis tropicalis TaxID=1561998 RepID=A0A1I7T2Y9_9PELO
MSKVRTLRVKNSGAPCSPTDFIIPNQPLLIPQQQQAAEAAPPNPAPPQPAAAPAAPSQPRYAHDHSSVTPMTMVKTLVALATERMLLKTSGPTFLRGIEFMYAAGLAPDRLSVMMTSSHKFVLQFHSKCDIRPFAANYPNFGRVLRGIVHVREWRIKSIEFVNVAFHMRDVDNLERAIEKLGVELVLLRNCTYPGVQRGDEAVKFLSALNRKKQAVVCEYGDDRLKHRIGRRASGHRARRASRNGGQEVVPPPAPVAQAPGGAAPGPAVAAPQVAPEFIPVEAAPRPQNPPGVRRPIPMNPEQAVRHMEMIQRREPIEADRAPAHPPGIDPQMRIIGQQERNRSPGRVVVGAHVYEFRAIEPTVNGEPQQVHNVDHLLNVLRDNAANDVRVIVLPSRGGVAGAPINLNNNEQFVYRQISQAQIQGLVGVPQAANMGDLPPNVHHFIAPIREGAVGRIGNRMGREPVRNPNYDPAQLIAGPGELAGPIHNRPMRQQQVWNAYPVARAQQMFQHGPAPVAPIPMFGDAVNEAQVQRNGEDSNDSTDREDQQEMYDPEQQRNEALRDLVADPEAQPNFAPVEAQAVDLDMLEEEAEDDEEGMEGVVVERQQFMINDQPLDQPMQE